MIFLFVGNKVKFFEYKCFIRFLVRTNCCFWVCFFTSNLISAFGYVISPHFFYILLYYYFNFFLFVVLFVLHNIYISNNIMT